MAATMFELRPIPGPRPRRVGGNRGHIRAFDRDPLAYVRGMFQTYGPVSALIAGDARLVFALGAAANEHLRTNANQFTPAVSDTVLPVRTSRTVAKLAQSARSLDVEQPLAREWHHVLAQAEAATAYRSMVGAAAGSVAQRWGLGQQLDLVYVIRRLNLRILFGALLGIETTEERGRILLDNWTNVLASHPTAVLARVPQLAYRRVDRLFEQIVAAREAQPKQDNPDQACDLLTRLERAAEAVSEPDTRAERVKHVACLVQRAESILTSALVWPLVLLSQHQRVLSDVLAELDRGPEKVVAATDQQWATGAPLPLLERVIKESLRLLPPQSLGLRQAGTTADMLDYALPSQSLVLYSPHLTHRLSGLFVAPQRFRPERWLYIEPTADEYLPLGLANDAVLDLPFVLLHTKLVLATWLQHSRLVLAPATRIDYQLQPTLLPQGGISMIVAPRNRQHTQWAPQGSLNRLVDFEA